MVHATETCLTTRKLTLQDCCDGLAPDTARTASESGPDLIELLLREQQDLSAVELFSRHMVQGDLPAQARYYEKLLPATPPQAGQQYAFEVDLDRCSGCKACVTACHSLNGLSERETWRDVGLLVGGTESRPVMQHVTAACHHCLEPGCLQACPVNAYEKDPVTGIVRHLDDQCFGCQYCTLACPYDVPKYHPRKGIVRKCDMCSQRLEVGEAPACVQACPHEAIAIRIVDKARVQENAEADYFLPAAPEPHLTFPTTTYKTSRVFPRNMLPADYYSISPQHPHWPLIIMLVLTQLSAGAFACGCLFGSRPVDAVTAQFLPVHATGAMLWGLLALGASTLHLGRPWYAYRGLLGLRHSWLSREILAFGIFAALAVAYSGVTWLSLLSRGNPVTANLLTAMGVQLGLAVTIAGLAGVYCSAMIYAFTRRELWSLPRTLTRFLLTSAVLGIATTWLSLELFEMFRHRTVSRELTSALIRSLVLASVAKLTFDSLLLGHLGQFRTTSLKRSALLVTGVLRHYSIVRLIAGLLGGVLLPIWVLNAELSDGSSLRTIVVTLIWGTCLCGELCERYLFFAAVAAPRMPGGIRP